MKLTNLKKELKRLHQKAKEKYDISLVLVSRPPELQGLFLVDRGDGFPFLHLTTEELERFLEKIDKDIPVIADNFSSKGQWYWALDSSRVAEFDTHDDYMQFLKENVRKKQP